MRVSRDLLLTIRIKNELAQSEDSLKHTNSMWGFVEIVLPGRFSWPCLNLCVPKPWAFILGLETLCWKIIIFKKGGRQSFSINPQKSCKTLSQENKNGKKMTFHQNILPHYCHEGKKAYISNFSSPEEGCGLRNCKSQPTKSLTEDINGVCVCLWIDIAFTQWHWTGLCCCNETPGAEALFNRQNLLIARLQGVTNALHNVLT